MNKDLVAMENELGKTGTKLVVINPLREGEKVDVSVIVTTFGADDKLRRALNSLLNQTFDGVMEILISYDKGSSTASFKVIKDWIQDANFRNVKVVLLLHDNLSLFRDRELSIKKCSGEYVCFLDYDNTFDENKVLEHLTRMRSRNLHFTFSNQRDVNEEGKIIGDIHLNVPDRYDRIENLLFQNFVDSNTIFIDRYFYNNFLQKSLEILKDKFFDEVIEDYFYALVASMSNQLNYIDIVLGSYTYHSANITSRLYLKNSKNEFIRIAKYNNRLFKTLVAVALVNQELRLTNKNIFNSLVNVIAEDNLQLLSVNLGIHTNGRSLFLNILRTAFIGMKRFSYILFRLRKRSSTPKRSEIRDQADD